MPERFTVSAEKVSSRPGCWDINKISVLDYGVKVGEYTYLYSSFRHTLFAPFRQGNQWYALCSLDYTATSLMKLPECSIIGGEKGKESGFCPVEYYVPRYYWYEFDIDGKHYSVKMYDSDPPEEEATEYTEYEEFAFLCGCHWGDDHSWKIQYIDLSQASKGIIKRDARFGYLELPRNLSLKQAIKVRADENGGKENAKIYGFTIAQERYYTVDGKESD